MTLALQHTAVIVGRNLQIICHNLDQLDDFFRIHTDLFGWYRPRTGSIAFPMLLRGNVDRFCADLLAKAGVLLLTGTLYGDGYNAIRIGFGRRNLPTALERLGEYIRALR